MQTLLEKFANRQLTVTESWEKWRTTIEILREKRIEHQRKVEESTRVSTHIFLFRDTKSTFYNCVLNERIYLFLQTMEWVSKFTEQLYPVITSQSPQTASILQDLAGSKHRILPELNKAVNELDSRIKGINTLAREGNFKSKLNSEKLILRSNETYTENDDFDFALKNF